MNDESKRNELKMKEMLWTFVAGSMSRLGELPVGHLLERIRVWMNTNPLQKGAISNIYHEGGYKAFYSGFSWNIVAASLKTGTRWLNLYTSDKIISKFISEDRKVTKAALTGIASAAITSTIYCPFELLKIKKMTITHAENLHLSFYGLLQGWRPMFAKEVIVSLFFNSFYMQILNLMIHYKDPLPLETIHISMVGALAGSSCAVITTPLDMIKDQMQNNNALKEKRLFHAGMVLYERYGLFAMLKTVPVKAMRSAWYFGITTMLMDKFQALPQFMRPEAKK